jgi:hypothetical protein
MHHGGQLLNAQVGGGRGLELQVRAGPVALGRDTCRRPAGACRAEAGQPANSGVRTID